MKIVHVLIGLFYIVYSGIHVTQLGIGEWLTLIIAIGGLLIAWFIFKKDLTGMYLAGMLMGLTIEYITEAYWKYSLKVFIWPNSPIWGDISFYVFLAWGYSFSMFVLFSNWLFKKMTRLPVTDARTIVFDMILSPLWFVPYEFFGMQILHLWGYTCCSGWTTIIPVLNYPLEGVIGAMLFGLVLPSFVRHLGDELRATRKR